MHNYNQAYGNFEYYTNPEFEYFEYEDEGVSRRNIPPTLRANQSRQTLKQGKLYETFDFIPEVRWD